MAHDIEVGLDDFFDEGAADLERDGAAVGETGVMHLGDGGGGNRLGIEAGEDVLPGPSPFGAEDRLNFREWERFDVIAEGAQLLQVAFGEKIRARGEELTEFDEGGSEFFADKPETVGSVGIRGRWRMTTCEPFEGSEDRFQMQSGRDVAIAVLDEGGEDLAVAGQVSHVAQGFGEGRHEGPRC